MMPIIIRYQKAEIAPTWKQLTSTGIGCNTEQTLCTDTCYCNDSYIDPTGCNPQTCNNVSAEPFCNCAGIENDYGNHYSIPESGNCMDVLTQFSTPPTIVDYRSGPTCYKARRVCKCAPTTYDGQTAHCACNDECVEC